jgi:hypothetical protein
MAGVEAYYLVRLGHILAAYKSCPIEIGQLADLKH